MRPSHSTQTNRDHSSLNVDETTSTTQLQPPPTHRDIIITSEDTEERSTNVSCLLSTLVFEIFFVTMDMLHMKLFT